LHIWRLNQEKAVASAHIVVSDETMANFMGLANTINECFHAYGVHSATLQPELLPLIQRASEVQPQVGDQGPQGLRRRNVDDVSCMLGCRAALCEDLTCCG
jgi:zinc transporter 1